MEKKRYSLEIKESGKIVKFAQIVFGAICLFTAAWWVVYIFKAEVAGDYWIATLFLTGFGLFQIYSGAGYSARYIEISDNHIIIKQSSIGTPILLMASEISAIDILPLSVKFMLRSGKTKTLRFGISYSDLIDDIKEAIVVFSESKNIPCEEKSEKI